MMSRFDMIGYLYIFLGAGTGGLCRYLLSIAVQKACQGWIFPIGTFAVNMLGCFIIGLLAQLAESRGVFQGETRLLLFVGLLGGFTTFSSFGYETVQLLRDGQYLYAAANAVLQVIIGIGLVWLGYVAARLIWGS